MSHPTDKIGADNEERLLTLGSGERVLRSNQQPRTVAEWQRIYENDRFRAPALATILPP